jgi:DNA (cytosine-5)-methyltransferase 1
MRFGSLFSGIGGFDLGLERAGMECVWQCEIDPYCCEVLGRQWPDVPNLGDVRSVNADELRALPWPDLICAGVPCQDWSVAGKRRGIEGKRSGLFFELPRIISEIRGATNGCFPTYVLFENVPGLYSAHGGRDFGIVLNALAECGAVDIAWRTIDSQHWVPQRRRRVFILAVLPPASDGRAGIGRAAEILALGESCGGHPAPRRPAGDDIAGALGGGSYGAGRAGCDPGLDNVVVGALTASGRQTGANGWGENENTAHTLDGAQGRAMVVAYGGNHQSGPIEIATALNTHSRLDFESETFLTVSLDDISQHGFQSGGIVRRLTPVECERLQGFPDRWTHGADGPRYRALGNAVTVPVAEWLGRRIMAAAHHEVLW